MKWKYPLLIFVITAIFSSVSTAYGDTNSTKSTNSTNITRCFDCHNDKLASGVNTGLCNSCHSNAHQTVEPSTYSNKDWKRTIHSFHSGTNNQAGCNSCHSPPACNRCHNGHGSQDTKDCKRCHGVLPDPKGHDKEASVLQYGKHNWMKCNNCHQSDQFHFREFSFAFNESYKLCSVCHSKQANDENHYRSSNYSFCVNCHNPHSTSLKESTGLEMPDVRLDVSTVFNSAAKVIGDNFVMVMIGLIFIISITAERMFKRK